MNTIEALEQEQMKAVRAKPLPAFRPGDTLKVNVKVVDVTYDEKAKQNKTRERLQAFEGVCISRSGKGLNESFTVRKISYGEGVERVFPLYSPLVDSLEVVRRGKETLNEIREIRPGVKSLFMSGYSPDLLQNRGFLDTGEEVMIKPFHSLELLRKVRRILDE